MLFYVSMFSFSALLVFSPIQFSFPFYALFQSICMIYFFGKLELNKMLLKAGGNIEVHFFNERQLFVLSIFLIGARLSVIDSHLGGEFVYIGVMKRCGNFSIKT